MHTYWMSPRDISSDTLDRLWTPDTEATVVTVQLRLHRYRGQHCWCGGALPHRCATARGAADGFEPAHGTPRRRDERRAVGCCGAPPVPARELSADERVAVAIGATGSSSERPPAATRF